MVQVRMNNHLPGMQCLYCNENEETLHIASSGLNLLTSLTLQVTEESRRVWSKKEKESALQISNFLLILHQKIIAQECWFPNCPSHHHMVHFHI